MNEATTKRIGLAASIIGAVGAIVYLIRKPIAGAAGLNGPAGAPGLNGIGIPGAAGAAGAAGVAGAAGIAGAAGAGGAAGAAGVSPSASAVYQYFIDSVSPASAPPVSIASNLPPSIDLQKQYMAIRPAVPAASGGGCGGGCGGCGGGKCPNTPAPLAFPDGHGACANTTIGRLQASMDACAPGNLDAMAANLAGTQYFGIENVPDFGARFAPMNFVGPSKFGAA